MKTTRKCKICGKSFNILKNDFVRFRQGCCEIGCYVSYFKEKGYTDTIIQDKLDVLLKESREEIRLFKEKELEVDKKKVKSKQREINRKENTSSFLKYISETYMIEVFPKYIFSKLAEINRGTFKGMNKGIPYEDLLDMFKRKQKDLDRINLNNSRKGNIIEGIGRFNYDLAIVINKYDDYLRWKNNQRIKAAEVEKIKEDFKSSSDVSVAIENLNYMTKQKKVINDDINIESILDDLNL